MDKGIKIRPKEVTPGGNLWLFASSSGEQSSGVYEEGKHGYFTYFLLKKLQETKGNVSLSDLQKDVTRNVGKETALSGFIQMPKVRFSPAVKDRWISWKLR